MSTAALPLSLEEKIAQLVFVRMGSNLPPIVTASDDEERVAALLEECPVGGLLLFNGVWPEVRASLGRLQEKMKTPLLVSADLERGAGQQLAGLTVFPHARAFAELGEQTQADLRRAIEITSEEALQAGVQILFAPVADANTNPRNPIIATRAYGEEPAAVAELVATVVDTVGSAGALAAAKHFPGHGDTSQDSHAELPSVEHSKEVLQQQELVPFRAAIAAGVPLIMSAHVRYPALDPSGEPATFSKAILTDLLRGELGFDGAVCSDSLLMAGATGQYDSEAEMAAAALMAGVDLLLDLAHPAETVRAMAAMVEQGKLPMERVDEALGRVMRLKQRVAGVTPFSPEIGAEQREANGKFAAAAAEGAIRVMSEGDTPRIDPGKPTTVVLTKPFNLPTDPARQPLADAIEQLAPGAQYFEFGPEIDQAAADAAVAAAGESEQVLLAVIAKPAAWHAFGMTDDQRRLADRLAADAKTIVASLGVPTILADFPTERAKLCTFSDVPASQQALARKLCDSAAS